MKTHYQKVMFEDREIKPKFITKKVIMGVVILLMLVLMGFTIGFFVTLPK